MRFPILFLSLCPASLSIISYLGFDFTHSVSLSRFLFTSISSSLSSFVYVGCIVRYP
ncbi:hypothetical protein GY45DRAFT_784116 [Cubamyces sp. BRFM 1775]|nr:hypothetical protein GY45DRAFT_784116 [Cubamyces sp. BRFM 1775]